MLSAVSLIIRVGAAELSELCSQTYCLGDGAMAYTTNSSITLWFSFTLAFYNHGPGSHFTSMEDHIPNLSDASYYPSHGITNCSLLGDHPAVVRISHRWPHLKRNHFSDVPQSSIFKNCFFFLLSSFSFMAFNFQWIASGFRMCAFAYLLHVYTL